MDLKTADETRTLDQLRTDIALDLLCGRGNTNRTGKGTIDLHVDLATLTQFDDNPGELAGYGPVIDNGTTRRRLAYRRGWRSLGSPDHGSHHSQSRRFGLSRNSNVSA